MTLDEVIATGLPFKRKDHAPDHWLLHDHRMRPVVPLIKMNRFTWLYSATAIKKGRGVFYFPTNQDIVATDWEVKTELYYKDVFYFHPEVTVEEVKEFINKLPDNLKVGVHIRGVFSDD